MVGNRGATNEIIGSDQRPMTYSSELFSYTVSHPVNCRWMKKPEGGVYWLAGPQNAHWKGKSLALDTESDVFGAIESEWKRNELYLWDEMMINITSRWQIAESRTIAISSQPRRCFWKSRCHSNPDFGVLVVGQDRCPRHCTVYDVYQFALTDRPDLSQCNDSIQHTHI